MSLCHLPFALPFPVPLFAAAYIVQQLHDIDAITVAVDFDIRIHLRALFSLFAHRLDEKLIAHLALGMARGDYFRAENLATQHTDLQHCSLGTGLDFIHRKHCVHRDVKPGNVLVHTNGTIKIAGQQVAFEAISEPLFRSPGCYLHVIGVHGNCFAS